MPPLRTAFGVFVWSRAAIWLTALLAYAVFEAQYAQPLHPPTEAPEAPRDVGWGFDVWARWDGGWFVDIARNGYTDEHTTTAFFPAYPLVVRAGAWVLGGHEVLAGVIVSLLATAAAFVLLHDLARTLVGADAARRALVYLALFPTAFFLGAVYSESLYLLLSVGAFVAMTRGRFVAAGVAAGLSILTRPTGVILLLALAVGAWRARDRAAALARLAVAVPIGAAWPLWLWATFDHPLAFLGAEKNTWHRHLSPAGPFGGAWNGIEAGWEAIVQFVAGGNRFPGAEDALQAAGLNLEALAAAVFAVGLGVVAWRRLGAPYGVFVLASVALPLSSPAATIPLLSMPRFVLGVFPVFIALAALPQRPDRDQIVIAAFAALLGLDLARWVMWQFVA
jgi:4-amino-4-deoxy-L-arabinose transferase-like glycosyltransferase